MAEQTAIQAYTPRDCQLLSQVMQSSVHEEDEHLSQITGTILLYAVLLLDMTNTRTEVGKLVLKQQHVLHVDPTGSLITMVDTCWWGWRGWSTWCWTVGDALQEAISSNSRGPTQEVATETGIHWLVLNLHVPAGLFIHLQQRSVVQTGKERNNIVSVRFMGAIEPRFIAAVDVIEQFPIQINTWANIKLGHWRRGDLHYCVQCGTPGTTWQHYCAKCWLDHMNAA
jgi:hypothetical protein